jgi:hypothetical protein
MTSLRHAIRRRLPEDRERVCEAVANAHGTEPARVEPVLADLERRGTVYVAGGVVKDTRGDA